jgi:hypothetical protein
LIFTAGEAGHADPRESRGRLRSHVPFGFCEMGRFRDTMDRCRAAPLRLGSFVALQVAVRGRLPDIRSDVVMLQSWGHVRTSDTHRSASGASVQPSTLTATARQNRGSGQSGRDYAVVDGGAAMEGCQAWSCFGCSWLCALGPANGRCVVQAPFTCTVQSLEKNSRFFCSFSHPLRLLASSILLAPFSRPTSSTVSSTGHSSALSLFAATSTPCALGACARRSTSPAPPASPLRSRRLATP